MQDILGENCEGLEVPSFSSSRFPKLEKEGKQGPGFFYATIVPSSHSWERGIGIELEIETTWFAPSASNPPLLFPSFSLFSLSDSCKQENWQVYVGAGMMATIGTPRGVALLSLFFFFPLPSLSTEEDRAETYPAERAPFEVHVFSPPLPPPSSLAQ